MIISKLKNVNWKGLFNSKVFLAILVAGIAFGVGRCTTPAKVIESTKTTEIHHEMQTIQQKVDLNELVNAMKTMQVDTNKTRTIVKIVKPDGTQITTEKDTSQQEKKTSSQTETKVAEVKTTDTQKVADSTVVQEKTRIVESLKAPTWDFGVLAGINLPGTFGGTAPKSYGVPGNYVLGAIVERKIVGNLKFGVWANTRLDTGLQLNWGF